MKIALVYSPTRLRKNWSTLLAQDKHIGIIPPLSLAYVAAIAENAGHNVIIIDAVAEKLSLGDTIRRIEKFSPDILGFTLATYAFHQTLAGIKIIKEKLNLPVMVGGWHLTLYPKETLSHKCIDYALIGEVENTLPRFLKTLEEGGSLLSVNGLGFRDNGKIVITPEAALTANLDLIPFPSRHLLENHLYYNILSRTKNFTAMLSTRGCPYQCMFCDLKTKKFRMRSALNFVDEIEINYRKFGIKEFDIYDSSFTVDKQRVYKICAELRNRKIQVSWTARSRVDTVDKDLLNAMAQAGCNTLMYGIETGDPVILNGLKKHTNLENVKNIISITKGCGIKTLGFFMLGCPGETRSTALKTIRFINSLDLDYIQVTQLTPFPNTELYQMLLSSGFGDYWREFTLDSSMERQLPSIQTELTPQEIRGLVRRAFLSFYFRPAYILKALNRAKSILEIRNSFSAMIGLLFDRE